MRRALSVSDYLERPWVPRLLLFLVVTVAASVIDLTDTLLGRALIPVIASMSGPEGGFIARLNIGIVLGAMVVANVAIVRVLPFRAQIFVVWAELLALFLAFFYSFDLSFPFIFSRIGFLIFQGAVTTIYISMISIVISCVLALGAALARLSSSAPAYGVARFYISFFRGTPLLLQIYLIYLGLPQLGLILDAVPSGVIALSLNYGAYMAEVFRAGIQSIPAGQTEASLALGMRKPLIMRKIILPQAMRVIVPPTGSQFIAMLKDSSLVSIMGVWELMFLARTQGRAEFKILEMLITAAIIYWIISFVFELIQARIEAYYGKSTRR
ncbi:MAG: amino acid ABC transporter permease [Alphaproteobacteria bacterium]